MKNIKKLLAVFIYLILVSVLLEFNIVALFDGRKFMLVILGAGIMYLPNYKKGHSLPGILNQIGKSAIIASYIQTFILLFVLLSRTKGFEDILYQVALNCRPILYGYCLWVIFDRDDISEHKEEHRDNTYADNILSVAESYDRFRAMTLTAREAEVAIQVCKGLSNGEIAEELSISETTVKKHVSHIFEKLVITNREQIRNKLKYRS